MTSHPPVYYVPRAAVVAGLRLSNGRTVCEFTGVADYRDLVVAAQPGDFYGGWLTSDIVGPVKGGPGTHGW